MREGEHDRFQLRFIHLSMRDGNSCLRGEASDALGSSFDGSYFVVHDVDLTVAIQLAEHGLADEMILGRLEIGPDRQASFGWSLDDTDISQANDAHVERARDRRRREGENVHRFAQLLQTLLVSDAESLLLV